MDRLLQFCHKYENVPETKSFCIQGLQWGPIIGPNFHLSPFRGVMVPLPGVPVYPVSVGGMGAMMVSAVQIGRVTIPVPPSAMERNGTVTAVKIIVVVLCGERQTFVTGQRITSSSYK